jgi:hypothetical protein
MKMAPAPSKQKIIAQPVVLARKRLSDIVTAIVILFAASLVHRSKACS